MSEKMNVYLEIGKKKIFACAVDWIGWCRSGRDEASALQALLDYGERYKDMLNRAEITFHTPIEIADFHIVERYEGNATTDFGAPSIIPVSDKRSIIEDDCKEYEKLLHACWQTFDEAVAYAEGKELRKGPRGGGRSLEKITQHVLEADANYLRKQAQKNEKNQQGDLYITRQAILETLQAAVNGEIPERGPRGGLLWQTPYFLRRVIWHVLDHTWEIEDRILPEK